MGISAGDDMMSRGEYKTLSSADDEAARIEDGDFIIVSADRRTGELLTDDHLPAHTSHTKVCPARVENSILDRFCSQLRFVNRQAA